METTEAQALAERLHSGDREPDGTPLLWHIRRVAHTTPQDGQAVAWLHEALETGAVSEQALLEDGLGSEELRALRLLSRSRASSADRAYLAHLELIAQAAGPRGSWRGWSRSPTSRTGAAIRSCARAAGRRRTRAGWRACSRPHPAGRPSRADRLLIQRDVTAHGRPAARGRTRSSAGRRRPRCGRACCAARCPIVAPSRRRRSPGRRRAPRGERTVLAQRDPHPRRAVRVLDRVLQGLDAGEVDRGVDRARVAGDAELCTCRAAATRAATLRSASTRPRSRSIDG